MTVTAAALDDGPKEPSTNLYVAGLPWGYHENRLRKLFQKYGPVFSVVIFKSRGSACVQLQSLTDAIAAKEALHGSKIKAHKEQHVIAVRSVLCLLLSRRERLRITTEGHRRSIRHGVYTGVVAWTVSAILEAACRWCLRLGNAAHAVRMQCKLLYVGNYLNPSFGLFSLVGCSITEFSTLLVH